MAILALLVVVLIGCGGAGGSSGTGGPGGGNGGTNGGTPSPYAGTWAGSFSSVIPINGNGPVTFAVQDSGAFTALAHNNATHVDLKGSGTIEANGTLTGTLKDDAGHTAHMNGAMSITSGPSMDGTVALTGDTTDTVTIHTVLQ